MNRNYSEERNVRSPGKESKRCAKDWNNRGIKMETTKWIRRNDKFKFSRDRESSYRVFYSGGYRTFLLQRDLAERKVEFTFSAKFHEERGGKKKKTRFIYIYIEIRRVTRTPFEITFHVYFHVPNGNRRSGARPSIPFADIPHISQRAWFNDEKHKST